MELILMFLGGFIITITLKKVIEENIIKRGYIKKTAKVIGFESLSYSERNYEFITDIIYPILELEEKNEIINLILPVYGENNEIKEGESIEIVYPKGKIESCKVYNYRGNFKLNYLLMMCGILIIISSIIGF